MEREVAWKEGDRLEWRQLIRRTTTDFHYKIGDSPNIRHSSLGKRKRLCSDINKEGAGAAAAETLVEAAKHT